MIFFNDVRFDLPLIMQIGVTCFSVYALTSTVFYYHPTLLPHHKRNLKRRQLRNRRPSATADTDADAADQMNHYNFLVISHRGGIEFCKENTLSAFKHSERIGVDMIELDVHLTNDGKVVVSHDNHLSRLAGVNSLISELNYDDLPKLLKHEALSELPNIIENSDKDNRIPLLEEVFQTLPNMPINLDFKINNDQLITQVNDLIVKYKRENITVWGSFNEKVTRKCHKLNENVRVYLSLLGCARLMLLLVTGMLPFVVFKETHLEIIMPNFMLNLICDFYLQLRNKPLPILMKLPLYLIKILLIRKSLVSHLQKRGMHIYYWTLNSDEEFDHAINNVGVNGIITDQPMRLIRFIENNDGCKKRVKRPTKPMIYN